MIRPQFSLDLNNELFVDNFAGGGGVSTGIERALGRHVDHAINHDSCALGMHRINHSQTIHHCEDVFEIDPRALAEGRPIGGAWFSPDCKHFSKAKGGKPLNKKIRGLVLVMLRYARYGARVMFMENVEEIQTWGPLLKDGRPDPKHKGRTWKAFLACLGSGIAPDHPDLAEILEVLDGSVTREELTRGFGYQFEYREIRACDYGSPTIRKRLFMVARRDGRPIVWPEVTHAKAPAPRGLKPWRTIAECIDWQLPCHSIFLTGAEAKVARCKRPLANATLKRIATGIDRYVLKSAKPFLVSLTHQGGDRIEGVDEPARTITGAHRGEKALIAPTLMVNTTHHNGAAVDSPTPTIPTGGHHALVEATVAPVITEHANGSSQRSMPADEPMRTQCAQVKGGHFALIAGTMVQTGYGERKGQAPRALDVEKPLGTVVSGGKHAVAAANLVKLRGKNVGNGCDEPVRVVSAGGNHHGLVAASVVRHFGESVGQSVDGPAPTTVAGGGGKTGLISACLAQHNGGFNAVPARPVDEPISTVSSRGSQQQVVAASLAAYYGNDEDGQAVDEPARTITTKDRLGLVESHCVNILTSEQIAGAHRVAKFLREHGVQFEGEFAMVAGYVIVDIGMRMLTPRELFRGQGFPEEYIIDRAWLIHPQTGALREVKLTKEQQIRMCGNSVCPDVAEALVRANLPEMATWYRGELTKKKRKLAHAS